MSITIQHRNSRALCIKNNIKKFLESRKNILALYLVMSIMWYSTCWFVTYSYPRFLTASNARIFKYFNLDNVPLVLIDELHSQGEDVFAFGEKIYYFGGLKEKQLNSLRRNMIEKGGVETNNNVCLIKKRHKIVGEFKLYRGKSPYQVIVSYKEIK